MGGKFDITKLGNYQKRPTPTVASVQVFADPATKLTKSYILLRFIEIYDTGMVKMMVVLLNENKPLCTFDPHCIRWFNILGGLGI